MSMGMAVSMTVVAGVLLSLLVVALVGVAKELLAKERSSDEGEPLE